MYSIHNFPQPIFYEIFSFISIEDLYLSLSLTCHNWQKTISSQSFQRFWLQSVLNLPDFLPSYDVKKFFPSLNRLQIIHYEPWLTNGGESAEDFRNSYYNMWQYNCDCYSSAYSHDNSLPLNKNICCLAYFTGNFQEKQFSQGFYMDVYGLTHAFESILEENKIEGMDQQKILVLDPLNDDSLPMSSYNDFDLNLERENGIRNFDKSVKVIEKLEIIKEKVPVVKKIAVARPLYFTGSVKTLIFLFAREEVSGDFCELDGFNDIETDLQAKSIGKVVNYVDNDEFEWVEFEENKDLLWYPALWLKFKTNKANHVVVELKKCHCPRVACAKLIEINDRRHQLTSTTIFQPNFDVMYTLLLGTIIE